MSFSLVSGKGLADPAYDVQTFPVRVEGDDVFVKLPPPEQLGGAVVCARDSSSESSGA